MLKKHNTDVLSMRRERAALWFWTLRLAVISTALALSHS